MQHGLVQERGLGAKAGQRESHPCLIHDEAGCDEADDMCSIGRAMRQAFFCGGHNGAGKATCTLRTITQCSDAVQVSSSLRLADRMGVLVLQWTPMAIVAASALFLLLVLCFAVIAITSLADNLLRHASSPELSSPSPSKGSGVGSAAGGTQELAAAP